MSISDPYHFLPGGRGAGVATAVIGAGMATLGGAGMAAFGGAGMATAPASPAAAFPMLWAGHEFYLVFGFVRGSADRRLGPK